MQWMIEPSEWHMTTEPPKADMWEDWNLGRWAVRGDVVDEPPFWEKYKLPLMGPGVPRGGGGCPAVPLSSIATYEGGGRWRAGSTAESLGAISLFKDLGAIVNAGVFTDASATLSMIKRRGLGKARHVNTNYLWIQDVNERKVIDFDKVKSPAHCGLGY